MLRLAIMVSGEQWDEIKEEFIPPKFQTIQLEHSLVSLSKWEAKWHKPFLSKTDKTPEETEDYVRCMTLTQNVDPEIYKHLSAENIRSVNEYIKDPMTATWFSEDRTKSKGKKNSGEQITAELIYYWMITLNIPLECQKWHLNRLLTLIRVCNVKNQPSKKMSKKDTIARYAALNAARRKQFNSKG